MMQFDTKLEIEHQFSKLVAEARKKLLGSFVIRVDYGSQLTRDRVMLNNGLLSNASEQEANVYAIWRRKSSNQTWKLMYIGQTKSKYMYQRLVQHLFSKNPKTYSKLKEVLDSVNAGYEIGVTYIAIHPEELRTSVEERLIKIMKSEHRCEWNIQS